MPVIHETITQLRYAAKAACHHHVAEELMSGAGVGDLGGEKTRKQPS
jgi:hypothetical protein